MSKNVRQPYIQLLKNTDKRVLDNLTTDEKLELIYKSIARVENLLTSYVVGGIAERMHPLDKLGIPRFPRQDSKRGIVPGSRGKGSSKSAKGS